MRPNSLKKRHICAIIVLKGIHKFNFLKKNHQHPHVALLCPITNGKTITFPLDLSTMRPNSLKKRHICAIIVLKGIHKFNFLKKNHQHPHVALLCPITNGKTITFPLDLSTMRPHPFKKRHFFAIIMSNVFISSYNPKRPPNFEKKSSTSCVLCVLLLMLRLLHFHWICPQ